MRRNVLASLILLLGLDAEAAVKREAVPAEFVRDQIFVTPRIDGKTLRFFTDTGGGWNAVSEERAREFGWEVQTESGDGESYRLVAFPRFDAGAGLPPPGPHFMDGRLMLGNPERFFGADGFLGGRWFADRVWEIDYRRQRLSVLSGFAAKADDTHRVPLGFQTRGDGERTLHFPSMDVEIDGEVLPMLLDTGATATVTASAAAVFGIAPGTDLGTSFIEHEVFERWHRRHPEWRVLEAADQKNDRRRMIEVPEIAIAGQRAGPVWFAEQPSGAFQKYMASMMDRPAWGALGGSALHFFRVVIDYPGSAAYFYRYPTSKPN